LNLSSNGKWVNCTIRLGEGYDVGDIDVGSITLNNEVPTSGEVDTEEEFLLVRFDRGLVQNMLGDMLGDDERTVELHVRGKLLNGTDFAGADSIKVVQKENKK
jgi:hypothetical protein